MPAPRPAPPPASAGLAFPAGTKLAFNFIYSTSPALIGEQATDFVSKAKQAGINITLSSSNFNYMITNYIDPAAPANNNKWAMMDFGGETDVPYATTFGLFNTGGTDQIGEYSNPTADQPDQRLDHQRQPVGGEERGLVPDDATSRYYSSPTRTTSGPGKPTSPRRARWAGRT